MRIIGLLAVTFLIMLVVGRVGWGDNKHASRLTQNEQITHISLWSILAAPMLLGIQYDVTADGQKFLLATVATQENVPQPPISVVLNWTALLKK